MQLRLDFAVNAPDRKFALCCQYVLMARIAPMLTPKEAKNDITARDTKTRGTEGNSKRAKGTVAEIQGSHNRETTKKGCLETI